MDNRNKIDYLRISVTDRCNLRCVYCMPKHGIETVAQEALLTFEEIIRLVRIFSGLGIKRVRLTGGEPLVRKGIINLVKALGEISNIEEVALTTNGTLLSYYAKQLKQAGLNRINISLDTLNRDKFREITGADNFPQVIKGIEEARNAGFSRLKLNMVVMKGINDQEALDFVNFCSSQGLTLRFIEFMKVTPLWQDKYFMPIEEVKKICQARVKVEKIEQPGAGPAQYYCVGSGTVGFIKTDAGNCLNCNRLRLTSIGELKLCLYETRGISLRDLLRQGVSDRQISDIIRANITLKDNINYQKWEAGRVYMSEVGG